MSCCLLRRYIQRRLRSTFYEMNFCKRSRPVSLRVGRDRDRLHCHEQGKAMHLSESEAISHNPSFDRLTSEGPQLLPHTKSLGRSVLGEISSSCLLSRES